MGNKSKKFWIKVMKELVIPNMSDFNGDEPAIEVRYSDFVKREIPCRICGGCVKVLRNFETAEILSHTNCLLCGQSYKIVDLKKGTLV